MKLKRVVKNILAAIVATFVMFVAVEGHALANKNNGIFQQQPVTATIMMPAPKAFIIAANPSNVISPTQAVQAAMGTAPKGKVVSIRFNGKKRGYVIRVKVPGGLLKLLVDGQTGGVRMLPN